MPCGTQADGQKPKARRTTIGRIIASGADPTMKTVALVERPLDVWRGRDSRSRQPQEKKPNSRGTKPKTTRHNDLMYMDLNAKIGKFKHENRSQFP
jgi:hypothetical protein